MAVATAFAAAAPRHHLSDLDLTVNMIGLCCPSNLLFEFSASTLAMACRARVNLEHDFATCSSQITLRTCYYYYSVNGNYNWSSSARDNTVNTVTNLCHVSKNQQ